MTGAVAKEQFGPNKLANWLYLNERTRCRLRELAGLIPPAWLRELCLVNVRQLLEAGTLRAVAEVVYAVDFATRYTQHPGHRLGDYLS